MSGVDFAKEILRQRSRQLKKTQQLKIVREDLDPDEVFDTGPTTNEGLAGMEKSEKKESHIKDAVRDFSATKQQFREIPVPGVFVVAGWDEEDVADFVYPEVPLEENYDLEPDDERWRLRYNEMPKRGEGEISQDLMETLVDRLERLTGLSKEPWMVVPLEKAKASLQDVAPPYIVDAVYAYWYLKRMRLGKAIYREFVPQPAWDNPNPFLSFRPRLDTPIARRRKLRNDRLSHKRMKKLRDHLQEALALTNLVQKREELKLQNLEMDLSLFHLELTRAMLPRELRMEVSELLRHGPHSSRFIPDRFAETNFFRQTFADPESLPPPSPPRTFQERFRKAPLPCKAELFPMPLRHLAYAQVVRLPGVKPFIGVPRLSRGGRLVFDPVSHDELDALEGYAEGATPRSHPFVYKMKKRRKWEEEQARIQVTRQRRREMEPKERLQCLIDFIKKETLRPIDCDRDAWSVPNVNEMEKGSDEEAADSSENDEEYCAKNQEIDALELLGLRNEGVTNLVPLLDERFRYQSVRLPLQRKREVLLAPVDLLDDD